MNDTHWRELKAWISEEAVKADKEVSHWRLAALLDVGNRMRSIEASVYYESLKQAGY